MIIIIQLVARSTIMYACIARMQLAVVYSLSSNCSHTNNVMISSGAQIERKNGLLLIIIRVALSDTT